MIRTSVTVDKSSFDLNPAFYDVENGHLGRNHFYSDSEIERIVELFSKDLTAFTRKAKIYASSVIINALARRNTTAIAVFYGRINVCGQIGMQICKDLLAAMRHICQTSGRHEVLGKSFFVVRKDQKTKALHFSFSEVKNNVWNRCLQEAKLHKASLLYFRLESPATTPKTYLDKSRAKAVEGRESSSESARLEAFNRQLEKLPAAVRSQVKDAIRILSSLELPN